MGSVLPVPLIGIGGNKDLVDEVLPQRLPGREGSGVGQWSRVLARVGVAGQGQV
jgi:hypothetical protein